jgi:hypothetical protein
MSDGYGDFCTIITRGQGGSRSSDGYDAFRRKLREMDRDAQREARKFRRQIRAEAIKFAAAARKAGLPVDRVNAAGFVLTLRDPEAAAKPASEPCERIDTPDEVRRLI